MESWIRTGQKISPEKFNHVSDLILNHTVLFIAGEIYRICEIEFYLLSKNHPDIYTHGHSDQKKYGTWYFHRHTNGTYKAIRRGIDISIGTEDCFCGILIRSIYGGDKFIEGPELTVRHILNRYGAEKIVDLIKQDENIGILDNKFSLIIKDATGKIESIFVGPRIGLNEDKDPIFREKPYRYLIGKDKIKKEKKSLRQLKTE